ncbi:MAG: hypothetical protein H7039_01795, partial [Bryobacteraceae bacterium]|nr:hypothetical protein [Bryobacteraceae bacterium]
MCPKRTLIPGLFVAVASFAAPQQALYKIDTFAGGTFNGDGRSANAAVFVQPQSVAVDRIGNIYLSDSGDHRIRRIGLDGIVQTVAGTGLPGALGDGGPGAQAQLNSPYGLALDSGGNLLIADLGNGLIRRLRVNGNLETVAGGGRDTPTSPGAISARSARLLQPRDVAVDYSGNILISDFGSNRVYSVDTFGSLSVLAGSGEQGGIKDVPTLATAAP